MPLIVKKNTAEYEPTPTGLQPAVCAFVEDIGWEVSEKFHKTARMVVLIWELKETMKDGRPFMISRTYSASLHEKAGLRKDLESWRGKVFTPEELEGFDLERLKGANCTINVVSYTKQNGELGTKVSGVMAPVKGEGRLSPINTLPPEWVAERRQRNAGNAPEADSAKVHEEHDAAAADEITTPF